MSTELLEQMKQSVIDGEVEDAERLAQEGLDAGLAAGDILDKGFVKGIEEVGDLFGKGEFFLPELVQGAEAMKAAVAVLQPAIDAAGGGRQSLGKAVAGTVAGDIHEIGKTIVCSMLSAAGFTVTDVGCDVPVETFVQKVKDENADLLLLSRAAHHHDAQPAEDHRGPQGRRSARRRQGHDRRRADHARLGRRDRRRRLRRGRHRGSGDRQGSARRHRVTRMEKGMQNQLDVGLSELGLTGRSFLTIHDFTPAEVVALLDLADDLKAKQKNRDRYEPLVGRAVAMIFMKTSTRTRMSFEVGIEQLGAQPMFLNANDIQLRVGETIKDTANVMSRYVDAIMIRTFAQKDVEDLAAYGQIPVINGLTDDHHPCQGMADALTIREHVGRLEGVRLVYVGDGNNVAHSLAEVGAKTGMQVVICTPDTYKPDASIIARAQEDARETGGSIVLTSELGEAVEGADVLYTDTYAGMGQEAEHDVRLAALRDFQVNTALIERAGPQVKVMHCLPAHWGEEITEEVLYSPHSVVFDQAENRLHAQKAVMAAVIA